ncbi:tetratricopeptide repeat protein [Planktothrix agardhii]|uniref:tetratricopeptide repeat protein n=1 Tax=Planktothrix agardhii TaxID=1160 RepID=UPI002B2175D3|nr:tetratricopeptide repeat protein [Planktothrix agardhii]MEA5562223.1 tetratricopeptide repeat protein [Planktothrix agardhii UHCC 0887]
MADASPQYLGNVYNDDQCAEGIGCMLQRIIRFFKRLLQRLLNRQPPPPPPSNPVRPNRSDTEYEGLFLQLLEVVHQGASRGEVKGWLIGNQMKQGEFVAWLEGFGQRIADNPTPQEELARRMVLLGNLGIGELGIVAGRIGREILEGINSKSDDNSWFNQGCQQLERGDFEDAFFSFEKVIELEPDNHEAWRKRGYALRNLGRLEEAIDSYKNALEFKPDFHEAWCNLGFALNDLGRFKEAINSFDKALEFKPDFHEASSNRGVALYNLGRLEEAINSCDKALKIKSDDHIVWWNRGNALADLGRLEEAINSYDEALKIKSDDYYSWGKRGLALGNSGSSEEAINSFDKVLEFKPDDHEAWLNRGIGAGQSSHPHQFPTSFSQIVAKHPELNQRGYQGDITCCEIGLTYVKKDKQPEGWGQLHHYIGRAHYFEGRRQKVGASDYYVKAIKSYNTALTVLTGNNFLESYLEVLRDYIKVLWELGETERVEELQREATDGLRRLIQETPDNYRKQQLSLKFIGFDQLTVDLAVKSGNFINGLELAEVGKNTCLRWMLLGWSDDIPKFSYGEMRQFLTAAFGEKTAIVYWHLSPIALTTFILKPDNPELEVIQQPSIQTLIDFEDWLTDWNKSYQEYREKTPDKDRLSRDWRQNMIPNLRALKEILRIDEIIEKLDNINHVILVPHRDLHYLPLESLFFLGDSATPPFSLTRLPSLKIGQNLQSTPRIPANQTLLNIENPPSIIQAGEGNKKRLMPLPVAEIESEFVSLRFDHPTRLSEEETTLEKVSQGLKQNYQVLHFAGHGNYNTNDPKLSMLFLKGSDRLTLEEIIQPDYCLNSYQLVCLAACETAVAGKQTILSEYVGLASGFLMQKVDHVLGTLWVVESLACSLFVIEFYYRWQVLKLSKTDAFTQTQTWLKTATHQELKDWCEARVAELPPEKGLLGKRFKISVDELARIEQNPPLQHPYYWAAFILSGYERL